MGNGVEKIECVNGMGVEEIECVNDLCVPEHYSSRSATHLVHFVFICVCRRSVSYARASSLSSNASTIVVFVARLFASRAPSTCCSQKANKLGEGQRRSGHVGRAWTKNRRRFSASPCRRRKGRRHTTHRELTGSSGACIPCL
jgi:hypothetical protein